MRDVRSQGYQEPAFFVPDHGYGHNPRLNPIQPPSANDWKYCSCDESGLVKSLVYRHLRDEDNAFFQGVTAMRLKVLALSGEQSTTQITNAVIRHFRAL
jgi:hypothetical protein